MDARREAIRIDVEVDGEALSGRASTEDGVTRDFTGWLGLVAALDALVADMRQKAIEAPGSTQPEAGRKP